MYGWGRDPAQQTALEGPPSPGVDRERGALDRPARGPRSGFEEHLGVGTRVTQSQQRRSGGPAPDAAQHPGGALLHDCVFGEPSAYVYAGVLLGVMYLVVGVVFAIEPWEPLAEVEKLMNRA